jgi:bifunctional DNase/RNase
MLIEVKVAGLAVDPYSNVPFVLLKSKDDEQKAVPIWIGLMEASSIATKLENIKLERPMTHDLMTNVMAELGGMLQSVEITDLKNNTYYAFLVVKAGEKNLRIDSRPSDAIALALRAGAPVFITEALIKSIEDFESQKDASQKEKWKEILNSLAEGDFGKYKM